MIKNYSASADTTITNSYKPDNLTRATGSNMGAADILEVFSIFECATLSVEELTTVFSAGSLGAEELDKTSGNDFHSVVPSIKA